MKSYIYEVNGGDWMQGANKRDAFPSYQPKDVRRVVDGDWFWENGGYRRFFRLHAPNRWWAYCSRGYEFDYDRRRIVGRGILTDALEIEPDGSLFRIEDVRSLQRLEKQHKGLPLNDGSTCGCRSHRYVAPLVHAPQCSYAKRYNPVLSTAAAAVLLRVGQYGERHVNEWMPVDPADLESINAFGYFGYPVLARDAHEGRVVVAWTPEMRKAMEKAAGIEPGTSRDWAKAPRETIESARVKAWEDEALRHEQELLDHVRTHVQDEARIAKAEARFAKAKQEAELFVAHAPRPGLWPADSDYPVIRTDDQVRHWTYGEVLVAAAGVGAVLGRNIVTLARDPP